MAGGPLSYSDARHTDGADHQDQIPVIAHPDHPQPR
jgi:hypothetical protein